MTASAALPLIPPPRPFLSGKINNSFAFFTLRDRIPVILTKVIDDLYKTYHELTGTDSLTIQKQQEAKKVIEELSGLKYELQRDKPMKPFQDSLPDVEEWNRHLELYWSNQGYFSASWLFSECYVYRRIQSFLDQTVHWRTYDVFQREKESTFWKSKQSILALAERLQEILNEEAKLKSADAYEERIQTFYKLALEEMLQYSLWGNAVDLSILISAQHADLTKIQNSNAEHLSKSKANIIADDFEKIWGSINNLRKKKDSRIDIVLDNAGFELLSDLFLADFLLRTNHATTIVFHLKSMPWFVSDTTFADFNFSLASSLSLPLPADPTHPLCAIAARWQSYLRTGQFQIKTDAVWTLPLSYYFLPRYNVWNEILQESDYLFFKGDLNYRKLVYDCRWDCDVPFKEAVGPLNNVAVNQSKDDGKAMNDQTWNVRCKGFAVLRTCKSDVCVGLRKGQKEELDKLDEKWMVNGKHSSPPPPPYHPPTRITNQVTAQKVAANLGNTISKANAGRDVDGVTNRTENTAEKNVINSKEIKEIIVMTKEVAIVDIGIPILANGHGLEAVIKTIQLRPSGTG
ncbi:hypothetical protein BKA69DRAFT_1125909 [Paraphysoderma sedebokerense]|nr:hypothetical protein BKA69DRAFT_1125909 [Paraphysoderma sedebokerense]